MQSERIKLVPPSMELAQPMLEAIRASQHELSEYLPWVPHALTESESIKNMQEAIDKYERFDGELRLSILRNSDSKFLGAIGLIIRDKSVPFFEIGYWLNTKETGKGYITEAVSLIEDYAFNELKALRLEIRAAETNRNSRAVAERCGYHLDAILVNDRRLPSGELSSTVIYSKLAR